MSRFGDGDIEYLLGATHPEATLCFPGDNPLGLERIGVESVKAQGDVSRSCRLRRRAARATGGSLALGAAMFRPVQRGRHAAPTHRGIEECRAFAQCCVDNGLQFRVEDVMVAGPPWNMRIAARMHNFIPGESADMPDRYNNRFVACLTIRWGRVTVWEDYEDTQRVADYFASGLATLPVGQR
jgi:hypothetical protein